MLRRILSLAFLVFVFAAPGVLAQSPSGPALPPPPVRWRVLPESPCLDDSVRLEIGWCQRCIRLLHAERTGDASVRISIEPPLAGCSTDSCPMSHTAVQFGTFPPGLHAIQIELVTNLRADSSNTIYARAPFFVRDSCGTGGGGGGGTLPFVDSIDIFGANSPRPCDNDSIRVQLNGRFPNTCYTLRRAELVQPLCFAWPCLPYVRVLVDDRGCVAPPLEPPPCAVNPTVWTTDVLTFGPLPAGAYSLPIQLAVVSCSDSFPTSGYFSGNQAFRVSHCGVPENCVALDFRHGTDCDAEMDSSGHASVVLAEASRIPLAGLQGHFRLSSDALRITKMEPVGAAAGMVLTWSATADGASWVLFSKGAPIPPVAGGDGLHEFLRVGIGPRGTGAPPAQSEIELTEAFASDTVGGYVPQCLVARIPEDFHRGSWARLCLPRPCDANGDGHSDVRDLVLMVRCLHFSCPDSSRFDCDRNGDFGIDDVLCCARRILHRDTHDTTGGRPAPDVHVALGAPHETPSGWVLPVRLSGAASLGGARLEIAYPSDRFTISGLDQTPGAERWLSLWDTDAGAVVLGLLNTQDPITEQVSPDQVELEIRLALRPGSEPGGSVAITASEFSALDGTPLLAKIPGTAIPVVIPPGLALSNAKPNPFSNETHFSLDLDRASQVEVTIHDLGGRRVATLLRGSLPAGRHSMSWNGATERGGRAPEGLYFVKCLANGRVVSQKVAILRQK